MDGNGKAHKRGRKPGTVPRSLTERAQDKRALLEKALADAKRLEREAKQRTTFVIGLAVQQAAADDHAARAWLVNLLRAAQLSARDRAEIAHLLIDEPDNPATSPPELARASQPMAARAAFNK
jgi:hypothetical protein